MSNPYRNALAELVRRWYAASGDQDLIDVADAMDHARALLAQPEPPELTDEVLQQMLFDNYRGAIEFLCDAEEEAHLMIRNHVKFARAAIAADRARRPVAQPLPSGYIDPEHQGEDLALLETFYRTCNAEGGTADEIHLRGIRAVLATHPTPQPPADGEVAEVVA
jgi:GNAT superfamily N-acetyltransferase